MLSSLYWIETSGMQKIAIMARPRAGDWLEDEIAHWARSGIETVISLLEPEEVTELGLQREAGLCEAQGIAFLSFPIRDRGLPEDMSAALRFARDAAASGRTIAVHCRAGIGRSTLMAAAILVAGGLDAQACLAMIEQARGLPVPDTDEQRAWITGLEAAG